MNDITTSSALKQSILAMMWGDAYVDVNHNSGKARLDIYHCENQLELLQHKKVILERISGIRCSIVEKIDNRPLVDGSTRKGYRLQTNFSRYLYNLSVLPGKFVSRSLVYPKALAILWQDDGTVSWHRSTSVDGTDKEYFSSAVLCTDSWPAEFTAAFRSNFNRMYGWTPNVLIAPYKDTTCERLRFTRGNAEKLSAIIEPYVVPVMKYKLVFPNTLVIS